MMNLLSWRESRAVKIKKNIFYGSVIFLIFLLIVLSLNYAILFFEVCDQEKANMMLNQWIELNKPVSRIKLDDTIQKEQNALVDFLSVLPEILPDSVFFSRIQKKEKTIVIKGFSSSREAVQLFIKRIQKREEIEKNYQYDIKENRFQLVLSLKNAI